MVFGHADISAWKALATKSLFLARRIRSACHLILMENRQEENLMAYLWMMRL